MSKRYCISPIVGSGTFPDPYRPAVQDVPNVNVVGLIPTNAIGQPKYGFALCVVATANLPSVLAVSNTYVFPDYPLDGRLDGMESETRSGLVQSVQAYDLDGQGLHFDLSALVDADSYRALVTSVGQQLEPVFSLNNFDVPEVSE